MIQVRGLLDPHPMPPFAGDPRIVCTAADDDVLFPVQGATVAAIRAAERLCSPCPLRAECLAYGLEHDLFNGVFGGYTAAGRRALLRRRTGRAVTA